MSSGQATPEQVLAAVKGELTLLRKRLIACRNRLCRETGTYPTSASAVPCCRHHQPRLSRCPRFPATAEAVAALDARFPWLRGAEKREATRRRPAQATRDDRRVA